MKYVYVNVCICACLCLAKFSYAQCPSLDYSGCCEIVPASSCSSDSDCGASIADINFSKTQKCVNSQCLGLSDTKCTLSTGPSGGNCDTCKSLFGLEYPACIPIGPSGGFALTSTDAAACCYTVFSGCKSSDDCNMTAKPLIGSTTDCDINSGTCYYVQNDVCGSSQFDSCNVDNTVANNCIQIYNKIDPFSSTTPTPTPTPTPIPTPTPTPTPTPSGNKVSASHFIVYVYLVLVLTFLYVF